MDKSRKDLLGELEQLTKNRITEVRLKKADAKAHADTIKDLDDQIEEVVNELKEAE